MDACYGGLAVNRNLRPGSARFLKDMMLRFSRQVLTAGKADEVVADSGGPLPNHSVFTGHLIEGIRGKAANDHGVITASSLMAYVYNKVSNDINSNQTPHYGQFDGDGDFIISAPQLANLSEYEDKDIDDLIIMPSVEEGRTKLARDDKISKVKELLSSELLQIALHDFAVSEVQYLLSATSEDNFAVSGVFSDEEFLKRVARYEEVTEDLSIITACIAYWAKPSHKQILQKILSRSTDRLESHGGQMVWLNLRWYPIIIQLYRAGIASVAGQRYDSLFNIFFTDIGSSENEEKDHFLVELAAKAILELNRSNVLKKLPGHERNYTPLSEYLFKLVQPSLDDTLFVGKDYEAVFDEFEVLFALVVANLRKKKGQHIWAPIGRFGWKQSARDNTPFNKLMASAKTQGTNWPPVKHGVFDNYMEFSDIAADFNSQILADLHWF